VEAMYLKKIHLLTCFISWTVLSGLSSPVYASLGDNNFPPRFSTQPGSGSEIVLRVKEGPSLLGKKIYELVGEDPDDDTLTFGVLGTIGTDILRIENQKPNKANIYLKKELDRETRDSYSLVLTLTDGKLGKGNFVSILFLNLFHGCPKVN